MISSDEKIDTKDNKCWDSANIHRFSSTKMRRRGIIEKRRRDRINHSLSELRYLIPPHADMRTSCKMEKAEILQMTTLYLKHMLGIGSPTPEFNALDPLSLGYRECASEVARVLNSIGLDAHSSLRLRLANHLHAHATYISQPNVIVNRVESDMK